MQRGLIPAGALNGAKARALLSLALAAGAQPADVAPALYAFGVPPGAGVDVPRRFDITEETGGLRS